MEEKRRWTAQEEKVVYKQVSLNPENLQIAFEKAARLIGRTKAAVATKWYDELKFKAPSAPCIVTIGERKHLKNGKVRRKRTTKTTACRHKKSFWQKVKELFLN